MRNTVLAAAVVALAGGLSGCGEKCNTEPVAKVDEAQSCTAAPGATVSIGLRLCPTCNQTGATCDVDTSAAVSDGVIQLDPIVEACEDVTSCPSPQPACQTNPLACTFQAPNEPGTYQVRVYDPATNTFPTVATLTVGSGTPGCDFVAGG